MPYGYRANTETIAATTAQTIVFADNTLPQGGISDFFVDVTGANNSLDNALTGVRVKLEGVPVVDITGPQLRALLEAMSISNATPAAGVLRFTIPMSLPWFHGLFHGLPAFLVGIPFGVKVSVELILSAGSSAGVASIGWRTLPAAPRFMPKMIQQSTAIAASTTNGRIQINYGQNDVVGFILPMVGATGITRLRAVSQLPNGTEYQITHLDRNKLLTSQDLTNPESITTPLAFRLPEPAKFPAGSYLEEDTGAGSAATDVFAAIQMVDVSPPSGK